MQLGRNMRAVAMQWSSFVISSKQAEQLGKDSLLFFSGLLAWQLIKTRCLNRPSPSRVEQLYFHEHT